MDPSPVQATPSLLEQEDEWDTDGFVIPSLGIEEPDKNKADALEAETSNPPSKTKKEENIYTISIAEEENPPSKTKKEENIYLGPHGAPPSQSRQQELNSASRKQRFKQKVKEADRRISGTGRENKVENLRELVGSGKAASNINMSKGSAKDWLDPHCNEAQFEKWYPQ